MLQMSSEQSDAISEEVITPSLTPALAQEPVILDEDNAPNDAESSPASEENHDKKHDATQARINKLTAKRYEEQRRADALEVKLKELEAAQVAPAQAPTTITAPKMPDDVYDEGSMAKYHSDMQAYSVSVAQEAANKTFDTRQQQDRQQQAQQSQQTAISTYANNAARDGVDMDKLRAAEQMLNQAGISDSLGSYIMGDPNGGKIVEYLGDNPSEVYELLKLDPVSAGIKIANELKPRALSTTPRVSNAPEPTPSITGGGVSEKDDFTRLYPGTEFI
jgi:hypothetical protein